MPLAPGTRLGPYEILSVLGAGGMGEVYKARDTRLERAVALKVIQPSVSASPEMRERFEREARAISALDHPHICMLYDVCRESPAGGGQSEAVSFLVMQYLEGETLADRLARAGRPLSDPSRPSSSPGGETTLSTMSRGPIPFDTVVKYGAEIAHALDAAHRRGIVHRDLKPGNVMLTKAGTKLLDFGLAKLAANDEAMGGAGFGDGATRTSPLTSQGAILGTLHYMSPEQLEGRDVDARSDIHAFGALLFEMLCGRRPFEGQSQAGIIAAIISNDAPVLPTLADPRTSLPVVAQRALDRLLTKCLAKNPDDRWQSAADLAAELQWIGEERLRAVPESTAASPAIDPTVSRRSRTRERMWMEVAAASLVALAVATYLWYPRLASPPDPVAFTIEPPDGKALASGPGLLSVSPDGTRVAFMTGQGESLELWVRTFGSLTPTRLASGSASQLAWSPSGHAIAFIAGGRLGAAGAGTLMRIDVAGGPAKTLAPAATSRATWGRSGTILFEGPGDKLFRVPEAGGQPTPVMAADTSRQERFSWPHFLPDGKRYLLLVRTADAATTGIYLAALDSTERTLLVNAVSSVEYSAGYLFYQRDGTLMAHPFDVKAGRLTGDAVPLVEDIRYNANNGRAAFSVSDTGVLTYVTGAAIRTSERTIALFDRTGKLEKQVVAPGSYGGAALSPDGRQAIVWQDADQNGTLTLRLLDLERGVLSPFTIGDANERNPVWSPEGASVVFQLMSSDKGRSLRRRGAGGGATSDEVLFGSEESLVPTGFSKDGQRLLFTRGSGPEQRIWILPMGKSTETRKPVQAFPGSTVAQWNAVFSPDAKWIAYLEGNQGEQEVYIQPYPPDGRRVQVSTAFGRVPRWTADGRHIVYRENDNSFMSVELTSTGGTFRASAPVELFTKPRTSINNWSYSMDDPGERFLLVVPAAREVESTPPPITVILNFAASIGKQ